MELDLRKDREVLRDYILKRISGYSEATNIGPGDANDAIMLITVGYYADQGGYVNLVCDTRENAEVDGEWTLHIDNAENTCAFPHWNAACEAVYEGDEVSAIRHDGVTIKLDGSVDPEAMQAVFGDMILDVVTELREQGAFRELPLRPDAFVVIEEFDGQYFWPTYETRKTDGRLVVD